MSVVIIVGGDGKHAVTRLETKYHDMTAEQKAAAVALLQQFIDDVNDLCDHAGESE